MTSPPVAFPPKNNIRGVKYKSYVKFLRELWLTWEVGLNKRKMTTLFLMHSTFFEHLLQN